MAILRFRVPTLPPAALAAGLVTIALTPAAAERLPIRTYTAADGLGSSFVGDIAQDAAGYLWFATRDGLSRWNGYEFITIGESAGFSTAAIDRIRQVRSGDYFAIANDGTLYVYRASPRAEASPAVTFQRLHVQANGADVEFSRIHEDRNGVTWGGGNGILVKDLGTANTPVPLRHPRLPAVAIVEALQDTADGSLWIGTSWGLFHLRPDGTLTHHPIAPRETRDVVTSLALDRRGRLWVGHSSAGVLVLDTTEPRGPLPSGPLPSTAVRGLTFAVEPRPGEAVRLSRENGLPGDAVVSLLAASDGQVWVGTASGLARFDGDSFVQYTTAHGLCDNLVQSLLEDGDGHLWIGTPSGAMRVTLEGFSGYAADEGLGNDHVVAFGEMPDGTVFAVGIDWSVSAFDGRRFTASRLPLPAGSSLMWASQAAYLDRTGRWWALASEGLYRFGPSPARGAPAFVRPIRSYATRDGLPSVAVFRLYEDRAGVLWVGTRPGDPPGDGLARFDPTLTTASIVNESDGIRARSAPSAFAEDREGNLWIGFYDGGLARGRDGRFRMFTAADGFPDGMVTSLLVDARGRLWVATNRGGIAMVTDPESPTPSVHRYTVAHGLRSNNVRALAEDLGGRIYAGTVRGVDRLDPATGRVRHYGTEDGLLKDFITAAFRDSRGHLWFGTYGGAFRLRPGPDRENGPPPIAVTGLRVSGERHPVADLGQSSVGRVMLDADEHDVTIDFVSVSRHHAAGVKYQYSLDAATKTWSEPSAVRSVNFAGLSPGEYVFAVRAISPDGRVSPAPATVAFTIRPPLWQRWWAILLAAAALVGTAAALYRYRVRWLLDTQRLRLAIASDLHDEVATNLGSIATFAALVRTETPAPSPLLDRITVLATESAEAIREIIWSIDPKPESIGSLLLRLRDGMVSSCRARGMHLRVWLEDARTNRNLTPEQRKNLWLMLKEAVSNAARHSGGTEVVVTAASAGKQVRITVRDNGTGTWRTNGASGRGLATMGARAEALAGSMSVRAAPGDGTTVEFLVRLDG